MESKQNIKETNALKEFQNLLDKDFDRKLREMKSSKQRLLKSQKIL